MQGLDKVMATAWTHCNVDIKILTKQSLDKADVDVISTHHNRVKGKVSRVLAFFSPSIYFFWTH